MRRHLRPLRPLLIGALLTLLFAARVDASPEGQSGEPEGGMAQGTATQGGVHSAAAPGPAVHGGGHGHHPAPINWFGCADKAANRPPPFAAMLFNFGALLVLLVVLMKKPLKNMVEGRYAQITRDIEEATRQRAEAEGRLAEYERRLAGLDEERKRILGDILAEGEAEKKRLIAEAKEQAERMRHEAQFLISQEIKQARMELERELVDLTLGSAETAIQVALDEKDHRRMLDEFIANLGQPAGAGQAGVAAVVPPAQAVASRAQGG